MKFNELQVQGKKSLKRVCRGIASGQGKTAGRGTKGQGARTGSKKKPGFEGGSNPLMQRLPKLPGFTSKKVAPEIVKTGDLAAFAGKTVTTTTLAEAGVISSPYVRAKLVVKGDVAKKVTVQLQAASAAAVAALEAAGGSFEKVARLAKPATRSKEDK